METIDEYWGFAWHMFIQPNEMAITCLCSFMLLEHAIDFIAKRDGDKDVITLVNDTMYPYDESRLYATP